MAEEVNELKLAYEDLQKRYLHTYLPPSLPTYLPTFQPTYHVYLDMTCFVDSVVA